MVFAVASLLIIGCDSTGNTGDNGDSSSTSEDENGDDGGDDGSTQEDGTLTISLSNWNEGGDQDDIDTDGNADVFFVAVFPSGSNTPVGINITQIDDADGSASFTIKEYDLTKPNAVGDDDFTGTGGTGMVISA